MALPTSPSPGGWDPVILTLRTRRAQLRPLQRAHLGAAQKAQHKGSRSQRSHPKAPFPRSARRDCACLTVGCPGSYAPAPPRLSLVSEGAAAGQLLGRHGRPSHVHVHSHARQDVFWWRIFQRLNYLGSLLTCSFLGPRTGPTVSRWETPESAFP